MDEALAEGYDRLELALLESAAMALDGDGRPDDADVGAEVDPVLPPMRVDDALQLLKMHRRTQRGGWEHREREVTKASPAELATAIEREMRVLKGVKRWKEAIG